MLTKVRKYSVDTILPSQLADGNAAVNDIVTFHNGKWTLRSTTATLSLSTKVTNSITTLTQVTSGLIDSISLSQIESVNASIGDVLAFNGETLVAAACNASINSTVPSVSVSGPSTKVSKYVIKSVSLSSLSADNATEGQVLVYNGSKWVPASVSIPFQNIYTVPGTYQFTVPAVTQVYVEAIGAGGGGGGCNGGGDNHAGGGGGSGGLARGVISVIPGEILTITVGSSGLRAGVYYGTWFCITGTTSGKNAYNGGSSTIYRNTTMLVSAGGGIGGTGSTGDSFASVSGPGGNATFTTGSILTAQGAPGGTINSNRNSYAATLGGIATCGTYLTAGSGGHSHSSSFIPCSSNGTSDGQNGGVIIRNIP